MSENPSDSPASGNDEPKDELKPVNDPAQAAPLTPPTGSPTPTAPRLRDRVFRFRSVLLVAAAGVIVGGVAGAGITAITDGHGDRRAEFGRNGFGPGQMPGMSGEGMPGMPGGPGFGGQGFPGQQQGQPGQPGQPGQLPGSSKSS